MIEIGKYIEGYKVLKFLGNGAFGHVYLVESPNHHLYAMKLIPLTDKNMTQASAQALLYYYLDHSSILKAKQIIISPKISRLAMVLEYCPQGSLQALIGKSSPDSFRRMFIQIAQGLVYLHNLKIAHRDIKPDNILISSNRTIKIGDLGISKMLEKGPMQTCIGSAYYIAPEVADNKKPYDCKVDVWSFGILMLELLLGKPITKICPSQKVPIQIDGFPSDDLLDQIKVPKMRELVRKMLKTNPTARYSSQMVLNYLTGNKEQLNNGKNENFGNLVAMHRTGEYYFSRNLKGPHISLKNENTVASNTCLTDNDQFVLVEGPRIRIGSSIKFQIQELNCVIRVGLALKSVVQGDSFKIKDKSSIGHGVFLVSSRGKTYSHNRKEDNKSFKEFRFDKGDKIKVKMNLNEMWLRNYNKKLDLKMRVRLSEEEWKDACFCMELRGKGDSVVIFNKHRETPGCTANTCEIQ